MCTITWLTRDNGYELFFNRDELRSRQRAAPPQLHQDSKIRYLAPIDSDAGGTWISANQFGLSLCLLNNYGAAAPQLPERDWISRGLLVKQLAISSDSSQVIAALREVSLNRFKAFDLIVFSLNEAPLQLSWNGDRVLNRFNPKMPITSSSFKSNEVIRNRLAQLQDGEEISRETLLNFHASHGPSKGAYSICMHREDAATVSFSHISVTSHGATYRYWDGAPCRADHPISVRLSFAKQQENAVSPIRFGKKRYRYPTNTA